MAHSLDYLDRKRVFFLLLHAACLLLFIPEGRAEDLALPLPAPTWRQILQESVSTREYQPVLDAFQKVSTAGEAEPFYALAEQLYTDITSSRAGSDDAFYAQKILLFLQIGKKDPAADLTLQQFRTGFSAHPEFVKGLRETADIYFYLGRNPTRAQVIYQEILTEQPGSAESIWAQRGLVMAALEKGDYAAADTAVQTLLSEYSDHPKISTAVRVVADRYFYANDSHNALHLYEWIAQRGAGDEAIWVQRGLVATHLHLAEYAAADEALETLQTQYSNHPQFDAALRAAADEYFYYGQNPTKTQALYEQILRDYPNGPETIWARRGLVLMALEVADRTAADKALQTLLSNYSDHPQIATAVRIVADRYFYVGHDPAVACALYQRILLDWPSSCEKMAAQRGLAMAGVQLGDESAGQAAAETLLSEFEDRPELSENTSEIIDQYCRAGSSARVITLSEKILGQSTNTAIQLAARTGLARAYIQTGQEAQAQQQIDMITAGYSSQPRFSYSLFVIGEQYYMQAEESLRQGDSDQARTGFQKAMALWEINRTQLSDRRHKALAVYYSAMASGFLGDDASALAFYQDLAQNYPDCEKAWHAQYRVAECALKLAAVGQIDPAVANNLKNAAYEAILEKYPDCPVAGMIRRAMK